MEKLKRTANFSPHQKVIAACTNLPFTLFILYSLRHRRLCCKSGFRIRICKQLRGACKTIKFSRDKFNGEQTVYLRMHTRRQVGCTIFVSLIKYIIWKKIITFTAIVAYHYYNNTLVKHRHSFGNSCRVPSYNADGSNHVTLAFVGEKFIIFIILCN